MNDAEKSLEIYESLTSDLSEIYQMAVRRDDLLSEDFSTILYSEIRDVKNRYGEQQLLNQGGMKKVFKVEDKTTGRFVAMAYPLQKDAKSNERFLREARITATLEHPNIMPVYDIGINGEGDAFFSMKLTGDRNLYEILKDRVESLESWPLVQRLNLFLSVCEGLSYAHSRHVLHLDIKPENILVGDFGEVLICDWGLGKILFEEEADEDFIDPSFFNEMTMDGVVKGTPGYMAPEQVDKEIGERDKRTDVYALGGILYALLSGEKPVKGDTVEDTLAKTAAGEIKSLRDYDNCRIPPALTAIAMKALAKDQDERYQNVVGIQKDVEAFLGGFATSAENASFIRNFVLLLKRHKVPALFLLLIFVLSSFFIWRLQKSERQAREILALYQEEKKQTELMSQDASPHLATQALTELYSYEFDRSLDYTDKALLKDPENKFAWSVKGLIHFYRQEFGASFKAFFNSERTPTNIHFRKLAQTGMKLKGNRDRLEVKHFVKLLNQIPTLAQKRIFFRNEVENYKDIERHMQIIHAMLYVNNDDVKNILFRFAVVDQKNILDLSGNPSIEQVGCIRQMPLHVLNVEGLNLDNNETAQFKGMPLEELNIAGTNINKLNFVEAIPNLRKLIVSKGQFSPEKLGVLREHLEIIEK